MKKIYTLIIGFILLCSSQSFSQIHANEDVINEFTDDVLRLYISFNVKMDVRLHLFYSYDNRDLDIEELLTYQPRTKYYDRFRFSTAFIASEKPIPYIR
jgi:hypothetical protein